MVRIIIILLSVFSTSIAVADSTVTAKLSHSNLELGKHTRLILSAPESFPPLDTINLDTLKPIFYIDNISEVEIVQGRQVMKLRLSAYHIGEQTISALKFNKSYTQPITFAVTDAVDPKSNLPIYINYSISTTSPWVRQQVLALYTLTSRLKLYDLKLASFNQSSIDSNDLIIQETKAIDTYIYKTGYAVFNLAAGQQTLNLPALVLKRDGTTSHRFYPPPYKLTVKALPLYLPATVPVGSLTLETDRPFQFNLTQRLTHNKFSLIGNNIQPAALPFLSNQLDSTESIQTYPDTKIQSLFNDVTGLTSKIQYTLPLKPISQGILQLEPIRLLNFDPERGVLLAAEHSLPVLLSLNLWVTILLILIFIFLLIILLYKLYIKMRFQVHRYLKYQLAIQYLSNTSDPLIVREVLQLISQAEGEQSNMTPDSWLNKMTNTASKNALQIPLNRMLYRQSGSEDKNTLITSLIKIIKARHRFIF